MDDIDLTEQNRTYHEAQSAMELLPNYFKWTYGNILNHISGTVLELGCGAGFGIQTYIDKSDKIICVDHDEKLLNKLKVSYGSEKIETIAANLMGEWSELSHISAETIIMMDVLEHFENDNLFLKNSSKILSKSGKIIIKVPAQRRLYSQIDQASGHYRRYDPSDLKSLAGSIGMEIKHLKRINPIGALAYRAKRTNRTTFSKIFSPRQLKILNTIIPIIRLGDFIPFLPGLSIICVLQKTGSR